MVQPLVWRARRLYLLDQRLLPLKKTYLICKTHHQVAKAIQEMAVRGAPLIGNAAAFALVLAAHEKQHPHLASLRNYLQKAARRLLATRPTAVNLSKAIERLQTVMARLPPGQYASNQQIVHTVMGWLEKEAQSIFQEDVRSYKAMSQQGVKLLPRDCVLLTYCNTGILATSGYGTAAGLIYEAHRLGKIKRVFVCETRPYLQGARLTLWEFLQEKVPATLITDNMAGYMMKTENVHAVVVGADRVACNGDAANKIGTYSLAILARYHNIPFYVVAPSSSLDPALISGSDIPIEERSLKEVLQVSGIYIAPKNASARHPAFDVTPSSLITAIITEKGVFKPPYNFS